MVDKQFLLNDDQMRQFITEGYLLLNADFPEGFNKDLIVKFNEVYEKEGNPGNNLLPRFPDLQKVIDHPKVRGALTSVLGDNYLVHPHRHGHYNKSSQPQGWKWHKDDYFGYEKTRDHRPWWVMIFYYPQAVTNELGPTGLVPGSQYDEKQNFEDHPNEEVRSIGKAGTFVLVHYNIWHRANPNVSDMDRYMLKFQFVRTQAPNAPSWNNEVKEWIRPTKFTQPVMEHDVVWRDTWNWLSGQTGAATSASVEVCDISEEQLIEQLKNGDHLHRVQASNQLGLLGSTSLEAIASMAAALHDEFEPVAINAVYGLSQMGSRGIAELFHALNSESSVVSRLAGYGLYVAGKSVVNQLIEVLNKGGEAARTNAAFALGNLHHEANCAIAYLSKLADDSSVTVRRNAVEALGTIGTKEAVQGLIRGLTSDDTQTRFTSALSLTRLGADAAEAVGVLKDAILDENRYVRALASEALYYIHTDKAMEILMGYLKAARWCSSTTKEATY